MYTIVLFVKDYFSRGDSAIKKKYDQVMRRIQDLISMGTLKDWDRLPSVRSMANQMGMSIRTVLEGYNRLENRGVIESRPQSGYFVRPKALRDSGSLVRLPEVSQSEIVLRTEAVVIPEAVQQLVRQSLRKDVIPLGSGLPAPDFFPNEELSVHMARIARTYPKIVNQYHIEMGHKSLLEMISRLMIEAGCVIHDDEIVVTSGATQAIMLALRAVTRPGDTVAVESPGNNGFFGLLEFFNLNAVEIPSDPQNGLSVDALHSVLCDGLGPACLLLSTNYSNPTGALMPDTNKEKLIELCERHNLPIIEDDTFGELAFSCRRPRPLKALAPNSVLYVGNFSRILAPGYGVGWLAGGRYTDDIRRCFALSVQSSPVVTQLVLASFLKDGGIKRHLRNIREKYQENMRLFQSKVARHFPAGTRIADPQGGHFLWIELPPGYDAVALSTAAINDNISIAPGILFTSRQHYKKNFRLSCAIKWSDAVEKAIERLAELSFNYKSE